MASLSLFVIERHSRVWLLRLLIHRSHQSKLPILSGMEREKRRWSQFNTVAHRGHFTFTYIFISRDKNTVYRGINSNYRAINGKLSRDKFQRHGYTALHDARDDRLSYGCDC